MYLNSLEGNETVLLNFIQNFRNLEQIYDANQLEYKTQKLRQKQLSAEIITTPYPDYWRVKFIQKIGQYLLLSILLLLSQYGTNFSLLLGIGLITIGYFGVLFWLLARWRKRYPKPIIPKIYDIVCMVSSGVPLFSIGTIEIFNSAEYPLITLFCLSLFLIPIPLSILTPFDKLPLSLRESNFLIIDLACEPTESCLFLCLSISSRTFNGITISLFPNEFTQLESVK